VRCEPLKPEHVRRAHMDQFVRVQKTKLVLIVLLVLVNWAVRGFPVPW
jgi:hypothetical protein